MYLVTQIKDIEELEDAEGHDQAYIFTEFRNLSSDCERIKMEEKNQEEE